MGHTERLYRKQTTPVQIFHPCRSGEVGGERQPARYGRRNPITSKDSAFRLCTIHNGNQYNCAVSWPRAPAQEQRPSPRVCCLESTVVGWHSLVSVSLARHPKAGAPNHIPALDTTRPLHIDGFECQSGGPSQTSKPGPAGSRDGLFPRPGTLSGVPKLSR